EAAHRPAAVAALVLVDRAVPIPLGSVAVPSAAALAVAPLLVRGLGEALLRAGARRLTSEQQVYRTLKLVSTDYSRIPEEVVQAHLEGHRARHGSEEANRAILQTGRSLLAGNLRRRRFYELVRRVKAPALVVHGARDRLVPLRAVKKLGETW